MKLPKKEKKNRYNVMLKNETRLIIEKLAKETGFSMSEVIEYCIKYTNEKINWNAEQ